MLAELGYHPNDTFLEIRQSLDNPDPQARVAALVALDRLYYSGQPVKPEMFVPRLIELVNEPSQDPLMCIWAIDNLVHYGNASQPAIPAITKRLTDPNPTVAFHAKNALQRISGKQSPN